MPTCFVVMGFGLKTDYTKPKTRDQLQKLRQLITTPPVQAV